MNLSEAYTIAGKAANRYSCGTTEGADIAHQLITEGVNIAQVDPALFARMARRVAIDSARSVHGRGQKNRKDYTLTRAQFSLPSMVAELTVDDERLQRLLPGLMESVVYKAGGAKISKRKTKVAFLRAGYSKGDWLALQSLAAALCS